MGKQTDDNKHEQPLQAVLIADTFDNAWHPITLESQDGSLDGGKGKERPLVLCPLNNVPLLKHSIDFLQGTGVRELFLISTTGSDALEQFLNSHAPSTYSENKHAFHRSNSTSLHNKINWSSKLSITLLRFTDCTNIGDALRELDRRNVIKSDPFILMQSDVITNVDLRQVLALHEARKQKDNSAIMTVLLSDVGGWGYNGESNPNAPNDGTFCPPLRGSTDDLLLALDTTRGEDEARILLWDNHPSRSTAAIPTSFFVENSSNITLTRNLLDIGLDICSPEVLARFSDEFDYRELRSQFVANCVSEEEIGLQSRIFGYTLRRGEYAGRPLGDMRRYHTVCMDVLRRWCYPLVPDNYHNRGSEKGKAEEAVANYICERHYVYRDDCKTDELRSHIGRSTQLLGPLLVGPNNYIGEHCFLQRSTLGSNCKVMDGCSIVDSHLWGNAVIEEGAKLNGVIVCEGGVVKKGAIIEKGCVIGRGCVVGEGVTLKEFTRITLAQEVEEEDDFSGFSVDSSSEEESSSDDDESINDAKKVDVVKTKSTESVNTKGFTNHEIVGGDGLGRVWTPSPPDEYDSDEDDDAEEAKAAAIELMQSQSIGYDMTKCYKKWKQWQLEEDDNFSEEGRASDDEDDDIDMEDEWNNDDVLDNKATAGLDDEGMHITGRQKGVDVVKELRDICLEHETSSPVENLRIELNSFKFSQNATYADCCKGAIMAVFDKILEEIDNPSPGKLVSSLKKKLEYWSPLFKSIAMGTEEEKAIIYALEILALGTGKAATALGTEPAFRFVLQTLHDQEIVNEEAIFEWAGERKDDGSDTSRGKLFLQKPTQDFLEWLEDESDDESGSEDDDSD